MLPKRESKLLSVVIPAAGLGSRLKADIPKCLVEIRGRTILNRLLSLTSGLDVVVVGGFKAEQVLVEAKRSCRNVRVVVNHNYEHTDVAQSIALAATFCQENMVILYGDTLIGQSSFNHFVYSDSRILLGFTRSHTKSPVGVKIANGHVIDVGRHIKSGFEWSGPVRLPSELARTFVSGNVSEMLRTHLPLPGVEVSSWEVDDEYDLSGAPSWLSQNEML